MSARDAASLRPKGTSDVPVRKGDAPTQRDDASAAAQLGGECGAVSQRAENKRQPVDIILGLDTTSSMVEEIKLTEDNLNSLFHQLAESGIDTRVILIASPQSGGLQSPFYVAGPCIEAPLGSGNCPDDANPPQYVHLTESVADWDILQKYVDLYPEYNTYLRDDSLKVFLSISDGDVDDNPFNEQPIHTADAFIAAVDQLDPQTKKLAGWRYAAIYSFTECGVGNAVGDVHAALVAARHGVAGDLCLQDFRPIFEALKQQVVETAQIACDWAIPPPPEGKTFDAAKTNVRTTIDGKSELLGQAKAPDSCGSSDGWYYDDVTQPTRVVACPSTCARIRSAQEPQVDLLFGCETILLYVSET